MRKLTDFEKSLIEKYGFASGARGLKGPNPRWCRRFPGLDFNAILEFKDGEWVLYQCDEHFKKLNPSIAAVSNTCLGHTLSTMFRCIAADQKHKLLHAATAWAKAEQQANELIEIIALS